MDELKSYISRIKDDFDDENMPIGHKERFFAKLSKDDNSKQNGLFYMWYMTAAAFIIGAFLSPLILSNDNDAAIGVAQHYKINDKGEYQAIVKDIIPLEEQCEIFEVNETQQLMDEGVPFVSFGRNQRLWGPKK